MDGTPVERIARAARWNGGSIALVAGAGAAFAAFDGDLTGAAFAAVVAMAGATEFRVGRGLGAQPGAAASGAAVPAARTALVRSELVVLATIVAYSIWRLATVDVAAELAQLPDDERAMVASLTGGDMVMLVQMFTLALKITYGTLIAVSLVYQGGMAWWYSRSLRSLA